MGEDQSDKRMNPKPNPVQRVIGLAVHPDSFTAALVRGPTPAAALVEKIHNQVPMTRLSQWARKHTHPDCSAAG